MASGSSERTSAPAIRVTGRALDRRTLLRGLGACVALPWLGAMAPSARAALGTVAPPLAVRRTVFVYVPNGFQREQWKPARGKLRELPATLSPLDAWKRRIAVVGGLTQHHARANGDGPGDHARAAAAWLTGVQPLKAQGQMRLAQSADQVIADHLERATPFRSLQVGCEGPRLAGECDSGYACAYQSHLSWRSESTPATKETSPSRLFDRLFRGGDRTQSQAQRERRQSVLDFVRADTKRLERRLDGPDRDRLDAYLTGIRELEARVDNAVGLVDRVGDDRRPERPPAGLSEHAQQLYALLALALEVDATRVMTFLVTNEGSNHAYRDLGILEGHHGISHHKGEVSKRIELQRIEQHHTELFAGFVDRLASTRDGADDLLDSTAVVYGSGIGDGNRHDHHDLPIVVAGDMRGILRPGQHTVCPPETPMNDLHLALIRRVGREAESFGDSRGALGEV
ncbi:MAG: DUF1552 domain-containing protein [Planctomycetota bacterium]